MTLNTIIADLKKSGCNSKLTVIKKLEKPTLEELLELRRDINEKICKEKGEGNANQQNISRKLLRSTQNIS